MLKGVVDGGTAGRLRYKYNLTNELAGKTGTTNNTSDAWFMGLTPQLVCGCWVGGDDRDIHFDTTSMGQGATMALPIFALFMKRVYADAQLGYDQQAVFDIPSTFDPCPFAGDGDGEMADGDNFGEANEIFE
jgi:penicillin-binding protein 1A